MRYYLVQTYRDGHRPVADVRADDTNFNVVELDNDGYVVFVDEDHGISTNKLIHAGDYPEFSIADVKELWSTADFAPKPTSLSEFAEAHDADIDELITKYAEKLQEIYDLKMAGAHTFVGVLYSMLQELEGQS